MKAITADITVQKRIDSDVRICSPTPVTPPDPPVPMKVWLASYISSGLLQLNTPGFGNGFAIDNGNMTNISALIAPYFDFAFTQYFLGQNTLAIALPEDESPPTDWSWVDYADIFNPVTVPIEFMFYDSYTGTACYEFDFSVPDATSYYPYTFCGSEVFSPEAYSGAGTVDYIKNFISIALCGKQGDVTINGNDVNIILRDVAKLPSLYTIQSWDFIAPSAQVDNGVETTCP